MSLVDADKVQSFSILPQSCGRWGFLYVYPVYLFTFIDYLVRRSCFSYCTCIQLYLVSWWHHLVYCKPNKAVMMLLLHCWYILTCRFNTTTAGLMPSLARMSCGPFEEEMDTLKEKKKEAKRWGIMLQTYQQFSSLFVILLKSRYWYLFVLWPFFQMVALKWLFTQLT